MAMAAIVTSAGGVVMNLLRKASALSHILKIAFPFYFTLKTEYLFYSLLFCMLFCFFHFFIPDILESVKLSLQKRESHFFSLFKIRMGAKPCKVSHPRNITCPLCYRDSSPCVEEVEGMGALEAEFI